MSSHSPTEAVARDAAGLVAGIKRRDRRSLARAMSLVENHDEQGAAVVKQLYSQTGAARLTGFTGAPGVGKSSLVGALVGAMRAATDAEIGVVSVDPSSPFTEGAVLGDRIRLTEHFLDPHVFIRSMGSRGHLGGLAEATMQLTLLLDAYGCTEVLIESVGVGQSEIEIASIAETVVLVLMPGSGDAVQALKAGIMEIPDIIVINKADHPAVDALHQQVRQVLMLQEDREWNPPIVKTIATTGDGVDKLLETIDEHREFMSDDNRFDTRRAVNLQQELISMASARVAARIAQRVASDPALASMVQQVQARTLDPVTCVEQLISEVFEQ